MGYRLGTREDETEDTPFPDDRVVLQRCRSLTRRFYLAFWFLLAHEVRVQLNRELLEVARPVVTKLSAQADLHDLSQLEIPGKLFEVLDSTGDTLGRSVNLSGPLNLRGIKLPVSEPAFGFGSAPGIGAVRFVVIPFQQSGSRRLLAVARRASGKA